MRPITRIDAVAAILLRDNVDTDAIIPSREITAVSKTGLARGLFAGWRYLDRQLGTLDPGFELNDESFAGAGILLTGANFGCGSSREYAVWALAEYGFQAIVASSFNPIFFRNCVRNGVLPAQLEPEEIRAIARWVGEDPQTHRVAIDLVSRVIVAASVEYRFAIAQDAREALLSGRDAIDRTLSHITEIAAFRDGDRRARPWAYASLTDADAAREPKSK